jgi:hypothetical protein
MQVRSPPPINRGILNSVSIASRAAHARVAPVRVGRVDANAGVPELELPHNLASQS